jgi:hypothetical protein
MSARGGAQVQPTKFELIINLKTTEALVTTVVLARVDEVIDHLLRCMSPQVALNGNAAAVASCLLFGEERT